MKTIVRMIRRSPSVWLTALVVLSLGIGANLTVFVVARATLMRPLPYQRPGELVMIWQSTRTNTSRARGLATPAMFLEWRKRNTVFTDIAAVELWTGNISARLDIVDAGGVERARGALVTPNFFAVLGSPAQIGRTISNDDDGAVVLSHGFWQRRFGGDLAVIGREIRVAAGRDRERRTMRVIGVLPRGFRFTYPEETDIWALLPWREVEATVQAALRYTIVGRLERDVTLRQAEQNIAIAWDQMAAELPGGQFLSRFELWLEPIHDYSVGRVGPALALLSAVTAMVLLAGCLNVSALLLAQAASRQHEFAVRVALGASTGQIARLLVGESLALGAGAAGAALAALAASGGLLRSVLPSSLPRVDDVGLDGPATIWLVALSLTVTLGCAAVPIWRVRRRPESFSVALSGMGTRSSVRSGRWQLVLVASQLVVVSIVVNCGAALLHSLWVLQQQDRGFDGRGLVAVELRLFEPHFRDLARITRFQTALLDRLADAPEVADVSLASSLPYRDSDPRIALTLPDGSRLIANRRIVSPGYFKSMGIPVVDGLAFGPDDRASSPRVAVVSQLLASILDGGSTVVGRAMPLDPLTGGPVQVVGVVSNVRHSRLEEEDLPVVYLSSQQTPANSFQLLIRPSVGHADAIRAVYAAVARIEPGQPIERTTSIDEVLANALSERRLSTITVMALATVSLLLVLAGLFGTMTRVVGERARELAIRVALGATRADIVRMLTVAGAFPAAAGVLVGTLVSTAALTVFRHLLVGVSDTQWPLFVAAPSLVALLSLLAVYLPARHVGEIDAIEALRE